MVAFGAGSRGLVASEASLSSEREREYWFCGNRLAVEEKLQHYVLTNFKVGEQHSVARWLPNTSRYPEAIAILLLPVATIKTHLIKTFLTFLDGRQVWFTFYFSFTAPKIPFDI